MLVAAPAAGTDTVYRCADNVYQSEPCPGGQALDIDPQRNVVAPERRRPAPTPAPAAESRERPEVIVIERELPPAPPVVVTEPVYVWPNRPPQRVHGPAVHGPAPYPHQRHPQAHRQPQVERPGSRAPRDVGRPAYGFKP